MQACIQYLILKFLREVEHEAPIYWEHAVYIVEGNRAKPHALYARCVSKASRASMTSLVPGSTRCVRRMCHGCS